MAGADRDVSHPRIGVIGGWIAVRELGRAAAGAGVNENQVLAPVGRIDVAIDGQGQRQVGADGVREGQAIKALVRAAFYGDADDWKGMVAGQSLAACRQAIAGLTRG